MDYNINSFELQYNRFATNFANPYFNNNLVSNPTQNQCIQCSDPPFLRTFIQSNANSYHIQNALTQRKCNFQKHFIASPIPPSTSSTKHSSTFTIDSILETNNKNNSKIETSTYAQPSDFNEDSNFGNESEKTVYNWLRCSRYKPPKVKKRSNDSTNKRKAINRGPRIPFTSFQITELENKFRETHYLSGLEVNYLANKLNLTDSRIRIWFQNRRARDKREKRSEDVSEKGTETVEDGDPEVISDCFTDETDRQLIVGTNYSTDQQKKAPLVLQQTSNSSLL